jgi:hypothetical protein
MNKPQILSETEVKEVVAVLSHLYDDEGMTFNDLSARIGFLKTDEIKFSRLIRHTDKNWHRWNQEDFQLAYNYIEDNHLWSARDYLRKVKEIPEYLYHALLAFYNVRRGTEQDTISLTQGLWRVYRPSVSVPEKYVVGMASIQFDSNSKALFVREFYRGKGDDENSDKKLKVRPRHSELFGYLCRKKQKYFIISCDKAKTSAQMTYLPHPSREPLADGEGDAVVTMLGTVIGVYANHVFTSRVYYERFDGSEDELKEMLDLYERKDIPDIVCAALDNRQRSNDVPFDLF